MAESSTDATSAPIGEQVTARSSRSEDPADDDREVSDVGPTLTAIAGSAATPY